ncbi:rubrerythrin [bacterium]|nr:rubrerythrin [bacterium]
MPEFGSPYSTLSSSKKVSKEELIRAIRFFISAEYEAIQLYEEIAEATDDKLAKEVLYDIANEEKVHAGEFLRLLKELDKEEEDFYKEGEKEVEEIIEKLKIK